MTLYQVYGESVPETINRTIAEAAEIEQRSKAFIDRIGPLIVEAAREIERRGPPGIFWPEEHARICKAAERVTRQQRRYQERQRRKPR
jgi:hypothetical protein